MSAMPLGLGLATSHAPSMFAKAEDWPKLHQVLTPGVPQPPALQLETGEVLAGYVDRIQRNLATLRAQLEAYQPDALIIVGDDQTEVFSKAFVPAFALFVGEEVAGTTNLGLLGQPLDQGHITLKCDAELSRSLLASLVARGFDFAYLEELCPMGRPAAGLGHAFMRPSNVLGVAERHIPTVIMFVNAYHKPLPSAKRCLELGQALSEILASRPERIAILGSGGLSHDPRGPRAGWIDEPLDHWFLDRLADADLPPLEHLFGFESATLSGGTGEIRSWLAVAGAFAGVRAKVVDYIPAYHSVTGLGFAYWQPA